MSDPKNVVVLGGGVAGLSAAHYLAQDGHRVTVVEKAPQTGGLCASFESQNSATAGSSAFLRWTFE